MYKGVSTYFRPYSLYTVVGIMNSPTMQSILVMCMAIVFVSTSTSTSFALLNTLASSGLFSVGSSGDWYMLGLKLEAVSITSGIK